MWKVVLIILHNNNYNVHKPSLINGHVRTGVTRLA